MRAAAHLAVHEGELVVADRNLGARTNSAFTEPDLDGNSYQLELIVSVPLQSANGR